MSSEEGVRATNDDASQCKRFAVDRGYWVDPYVSMFTPKAKQIHAPEISIGYYARVKGLRLLLEKFIALTDGKCQVVSLGAGFDSLFWNLKDTDLFPASYVEVDFSAITSRKIHYIRRSPALLQKITSDDDDIRFSNTDLHSKGYHLVSANLKNLSEFDHKLSECEIDKNLPTAFIAECVLVYIDKTNTDNLLKWISDKFPSVLFINYEQVNMGDRFGEIMMDNLRSRECMLHIEYCANLETQIKRCLDRGFEAADAMEMRHVLSSLPQADVQRRRTLEDGGYLHINEGPSDIVITRVEAPKDIITTRVEPPKDIVITRTEPSKDVVISKVEPPIDVMVTRVEPSKDVFIHEREDDGDADSDEGERYMTVYHSSGIPSWQPVSLTKENISTICPYSKRQMEEPVRNIHCGHNYEKKAIKHYIESSRNPRCPLSGCMNDRRLCSSDLEDNKTLRFHIEELMRPAKRRRP